MRLNVCEIRKQHNVCRQHERGSSHESEKLHHAVVQVAYMTVQVIKNHIIKSILTLENDGIGNYQEKKEG